MCRLVFLLCTCSCLSAAAVAGHAWVNGTGHDYGQLQPAGRYEHRFLLLNTSDKPLIVDNVRTPCGCTAVDWPEFPIAPGDTSAIVVEFHATTPGPFYKVIRVFFQGQKGHDQLTVRGMVTAL
jgi:hypothetical protein